jgi:hypothetical protein
MLRPSASLSGCQAQLGPKTRFLLQSDSCGFVDVGRPLCREDGSVVYNWCWSSPAQSFSGPRSSGIMTIFYCLRFETLPTWRAMSLYLYPPGTGFPFRRLLRLAGSLGRDRIQNAASTLISLGFLTKLYNNFHFSSRTWCGPSFCESWESHVNIFEASVVLSEPHCSINPESHSIHASRGLFRKSAAIWEANSTLILTTPLFIILSRFLWNERKYISYKYQQNVVLAVGQGDSISAIHSIPLLQQVIRNKVVIQLNVYELCVSVRVGVIPNWISIKFSIEGLL